MLVVSQLPSGENESVPRTGLRVYEEIDQRGGTRVLRPGLRPGETRAQHTGAASRGRRPRGKPKLLSGEAKATAPVDQRGEAPQRRRVPRPRRSAGAQPRPQNSN